MARHETKLCTFLLDQLLFGVDVLRVQEVIRRQQVTRVPLADGCVRGLINLRGQILTAIDLRLRLGMAPRVGEAASVNVIVVDGDSAASLMVDEIADVVTVDDSTLGAIPQNLSPAVRSLILAVHKLPERLLLVLDTAAAIELGGVPELALT